jgi:hypothetical protein
MSDTTTPVSAAPDVAGTDEKNPLIARQRKAVTEYFGSNFFKDNYLPVMVEFDVLVQSPHGIKMLKRDFKFVSLCSMLEYTYRSWKGFSQSVLDGYADVLIKKFSNVNELLTKTCNRLEKIMKDNGQAENNMPIFFNVFHSDVPLISSHARNFLVLLTKLDRIHLLAAKANMTGIIDSRQREEFERLARRAIAAFSGTSRTEVRKVWSEANRLLRTKREAGQEVLSEHAEAVTNHGNAIQEFESAADKDAQHDSGADLGGKSPDEFVSEALEAMATKDKKKTKKNTETADTASSNHAHGSAETSQPAEA